MMCAMGGRLLMFVKAFFVLLGIGFLLACAPCDGDKDLLSIPVTSAMPAAGEDLQYYREQLQKYNGTENIAHIVSQLLGEKYAGAKSRASLVEKNMEGDHVLYDVVLIFDDVPDGDSSSGYRYDMRLRMSGDKYEIVEMKESWRCWPDRGHRSFGVEPCE